jgi:hypothetical protein
MRCQRWPRKLRTEPKPGFGRSGASANPASLVISRRVDAGKSGPSHFHPLSRARLFSHSIMADQNPPIEEIKTYPIAERTGPNAQVKPWVDQEGYAKLYKESIEQPDQFWDRVCPSLCRPTAPGSYPGS